MTTSRPQTRSSLAPSRRTVAKGAAWAVPALVVAAPAIAYTTSGNIVTATGNGAKLQGNSCCASEQADCPYYKQGYRYYFIANNPPGKDACIVITSVVVGGAQTSPYQIWLADNTRTSGCCGDTNYHAVSVPANSKVSFAIDTQASSSANTTINITYDVYDASTCHLDYPDVQASQVLRTPPTQGDCAPF